MVIFGKNPLLRSRSEEFVAETTNSVLNRPLWWGKTAALRENLTL